MKVKVTFTEPVLGTLSGNSEVAKEFILSKHPEGIPKEDELASLPLDEAVEKTSTLFPRTEDGTPFIWDYQWRGFLKEACEAMIHMGTMTQEELKKLRLTQYLYKKTIDQMVFFTRKSLLSKQPDGFLERPLRGMTMRGERISLARSERIPAGTECEFEVTCLNKNLEPFIEKWLDYGVLKGMLQWRSGGYGRFTWTKV